MNEPETVIDKLCTAHAVAKLAEREAPGCGVIRLSTTTTAPQN